MWAGDQRQKLFRNLETLRGDILLSAVTAPGADELPWDEQACAGLGAHKHSGKQAARERLKRAYGTNVRRLSSVHGESGGTG